MKIASSDSIALTRAAASGAAATASRRSASDQTLVSTKGSSARALRLVIVGGVPIELAHEVKQPFLPPSRDKLLQCFGNGGLLRAFAAHFKRPFD